jgi:GGDEF domain-containing protein
MGGLLERPNPPGAAGSSTVLFDRAEMQERISSIRSGEFFLLLLRARGVQLARVQLGDDVAAQLIAAFVARLRNMLPMDAEIGQWGEEEFIALVPRATAALSSSINKRVMENLPGPYGCVLGGKAVRPALEINVCGVSSVFQEDQEHIEDRLEGFFSRI